MVKYGENYLVFHFNGWTVLHVNVNPAQRNSFKVIFKPFWKGTTGLKHMYLLIKLNTIESFVNFYLIIFSTILG